MNTIRLRCATALIWCMSIISLASAEAPRQLRWEDLTPKPEASENPFAKLTAVKSGSRPHQAAAAVLSSSNYR